MEQNTEKLIDQIMETMSEEEIKKAAKIGIAISVGLLSRTIKTIQEVTQYGEEK